ncbi:MAG TPA: hypothetical protein EYN54_02510 [Methylococcaceae bacterium]|nr:hypothetical protein [Methylococcaceae bacterium]
MNYQDIINNSNAEITLIASEVGIDWPSTESVVTFPCKLNSTLTKTLDKSSNGKCGIITDIKHDRKNREYPVIIFRTFKNGGYSVVWSGYKMMAEMDKSGTSFKLDLKELNERIAARQVIKDAIEKQELEENLAKRTKSMQWWDNMPKCTNSDYLNKKQITEVLNVLDFRTGSTKQDGEFIAYPLYDLSTNLQVGFERIYLIGGKKVSTGAGGNVTYHGIIKGDPKLPVYVTEGMADAYTVHVATGATVYIAISTSNIEKIVKHLVPITNQAVIVAIDNDEAGHKAVEKIELDKGSFIAAAPTKQKDFNDVLVKEGIANVIEQLNMNLVYVYTTEHNKYFTSKINEGFINLLIGEKGTGKTTSVKKFIDLLPSDQSVLVCTHRKTLNQQIAKDLGFDYYEDVKEILGKKELENSNRLVCSPESLPHISASRHYDVVFIDECEQVLAHCTKSDTMRGNAKLSTDMLTSFCYRADTVILSDANLSNNTYTFLDNMSMNGSKDVMKLVNTYKPRIEQQAKVYLHTSKAVLIGMAAEDSRKAFCFSDEKERATEFYEARQGKGLLVTSKTIDSVSRIMENINDHVKDYDTVCGSPSMGTGVSVDVGHGYTVGYGLFGGMTTTVQQCQQQMARFRGLSEFHIVAAERYGNLPETAKEVTQKLITTPMMVTSANCGISLNGDVMVDSFAKLWCSVTAEHNKSKNDFLNNLIAALELEGFEVIIVEEEDESLKCAGNELLEVSAERREKEKEERIANKADELKVEFDIDINLATYIAEKNESKGLLTKGLRNLSIARMSPREATARDTSQLKSIIKGSKSSAQVTHYNEGGKLLRRLAKAAGINLEDLTTNGKTWSTDSEKGIKKFMYAANKENFSFLRMSLTSASKKKPVLWFNNTLSRLGLEVIIESRTNEATTFTVSQQSLEALKALTSKDNQG